MNRIGRLVMIVLVSGASRAAVAQEPVRVNGDSITAQFVDAELRSVIQTLGRFLSKPVLATNIPAVRVSLETPRPIPRAQAVALIRGLLDAQSLDLVEDSTFFRVRARPTETPQPMVPSPPAPTRRVQDPQLFVVRLRHARAADVAGTVNILFGGSGSFSGPSGLSTGTLSDELRRSVVPAVGVRAPTANPSASPATLAGPVTIVPDEMTNSLLIRAQPDDYRLIQQAINELDIRPLQVLVEVLIVEARRDRTFSLGADLFVPPQGVRGGGTVQGTVAGGGLGDLVIQLLDIGKGRIDATIRAAESRGDVEIVSRPVLLAANNTEARFLVGSQRPFVQVSRSLPTDAPQRDQVVQYRDVGTRLVVRPTINHDGYVSLEIQQEVNAATNETQFDAPIISTREASTRVLLRDGQTVVIGGMRDLQKDNTRHGVPFLSQLPIIGGLFGSAQRQNTSTELFLFVTPRILTTDDDADSVTARRLPAETRP